MLQGRCEKGLDFLGGLPELWKQGSCSRFSQALCGLVCQARALQGRWEKEPGFSRVLPGLWKEVCCPCVVQALCGQDSRSAAAFFQCCWLCKFPALPKEEHFPSVAVQALFEDPRMSQGLWGPCWLFPARFCGFGFDDESFLAALGRLASSRPAWICLRRSCRISMAPWIVPD